MYKKTLAVLLVVLMLVMGGVKIKAESCMEIGSRTVGRCDGDNCYKNGSISPHYISNLIIKYRCWSNSGIETIREELVSSQRSGCC